MSTKVYPQVSLKEGAKMLSDMLILAATEHAGDVDKSGRPYILHPLKVMYYLKTEDYELMCIALGHDLIEDHGKTVTYQRLFDMGFSQRIIDSIKALTKLPGQTYEEYVAGIKANIDAIRVKKQDLRHNSDLRRLKGVSEKDLQRTAKYMKLYHELNEAMI